jgi:hypothetical protein
MTPDILAARKMISAPQQPAPAEIIQSHESINTTVDGAALLVRQFRDLEAAKEQFKANGDYRGVVGCVDALLRHSDKILPTTTDGAEAEIKLGRVLDALVKAVADKPPEIRDMVADAIAQAEGALADG